MVTFTACRSKPELVVPARATPREVKSLSDVDNLPELRSYTSMIEFFRCRSLPEGRPASSLKAALAEALVHYYPIAGRLRELPGGKKLAVDCTAEGVVFVEAHADVRLEELGQPMVPPYPCVDQFMRDVGESYGAVIGMPLLYLQTTRLRCGGLVLVLTFNHSIADAFGIIQFLTCIVDHARGQPLPAILPSWERHLLVSRAAFVSAKPLRDRATPPPPPPPPLGLDDMVTRSFLFGPREIAALRRGIPARIGRSATVFELVTAAAWRCRTAALYSTARAAERVRVMFAANARGRWKRDPPLPPGFYGNAFFVTTAEAATSELSDLARAVELVREAKLRVTTDEHVRLALDLMARGEYRASMDPQLEWTFMVSDITRCGDDSLDLGWAERVAGGVPMAGNYIIDRVQTSCMRCKDANGDECVVVPMCLPEPAMSRLRVTAKCFK